MPARPDHNNSPALVGAAATKPLARYLEATALLVLLAVLAFRPLLNELYEQLPLQPWLAELAPPGPGPATTILVGAAIQLAILLWLLGRAVDRRLAYRPTGLEIGWLICLAAAVVSCCAAGNKRVAITAATDLLLQVAAAMLLVQLLQNRWHCRLLLIVLLASAAAVALKCLAQWAFEFAQTQQFYHDYARYYVAPSALGDQGFRRLFESRLRAAEATGYFFHSNVAGEYLVMVALAGFGLAFAALRAAAGRLARTAAAALLILPLLCCAALWLTRSRGALLAGAALAVLILAVAALSWWRQGRRRLAVLAGSLPALAILAAGYLGVLVRFDLPSAPGAELVGQLGDSLAFRLHYWQAAGPMIADHGLTGVGPANFGRRYLQYKLAGAPEEVQNPHNLLVNMTAEWGWLGCIGLLAMLAGAAVVLVRSRSAPPSQLARRPSALPWILAVGCLLTIAGTLLYRHHLPALIMVEAVLPAVVWLVTGLLLYVMLEVQDAAGGVLTGLIRPFIIAGAGAFLLANMVGFSFLVPGAGQTFWALLALAIALRCGDSQRPARSARPAVALGIFCVAAGLYWIVLGFQPLRAAALTHQAELSSDPRQRLAMYDEAVRADSLDPAAAQAAAERLPDMPPSQAIDAVIAHLTEAIRRDPYQAALYRKLAGGYELRYELTGATQDLRTACRWMVNAVDLYPTYPMGRVILGRLLARTARVTADQATYRAAIAQLDEGLRLDDLYVPAEMRRFEPELRVQLTELIGQLRRESADLDRSAD